MISGSASGCLGLQNKAFGTEIVAKNNFSHVLGFCRLRCRFCMFFMALGLILQIFAALETGTKFDGFRWLSGGPGAEGAWLAGGME